jgi:hypothetical protein
VILMSRSVKEQFIAPRHHERVAVADGEVFSSVNAVIAWSRVDNRAE